MRRRQSRMSVRELVAQLTRIERNQHILMRVLLRMESEIIMAYEAELDAAEAEAKANSDQEDAAEAVMKTLADLVAALKAGSTDPATAARIVALSTALHDRAARMAAAIAATPTT